MTFRVVAGKLELLSRSLVCRLREGDRLVSCTVSRQALRDLGAYHQLQLSDEAVFSQLLPEVERLANERIRAGEADETGNVTIGPSDLVRYGPGTAASIAHTSASIDPDVLAMDWQLSRGHLAKTDAAIVDGLQEIAKQRLKIEQLRGRGHDTAHAESLLLILLELQRGHEDYSSWLQARLARMLPGCEVGSITRRQTDVDHGSAELVVDQNGII